jgi:hypothetical protein
MEDFLVGMAASVILRLLENADSRTKWRRMLIKVFRSIGAALIDDPEMQASAKQLGRG